MEDGVQDVYLVVYLLPLKAEHAGMGLLARGRAPWFGLVLEGRLRTCGGGPQGR